MESTIQEELTRIGRTNLSKRLEKKGVKIGSFNEGIRTGHFSKRIAENLHDITMLHASFWMNPEKYGTAGELL